MRGRRRLLLVVPILGALAGVATGVPLAGGVDNPSQKLAVATFRGKIDGIVSVLQPGRALRARLDVSLHDLRPGGVYRVVVSRRTCSQTDTAAGRVLLVDLTAGPTNDDLYRRLTSLPLRSSLDTARSVRIYHLPPNRPPTQLCGDGNDVIIETLE